MIQQEWDGLLVPILNHSQIVFPVQQIIARWHVLGCIQLPTNGARKGAAATFTLFGGRDAFMQFRVAPHTPLIQECRSNC